MSVFISLSIFVWHVAVNVDLGAGAATWDAPPSLLAVNASAASEAAAGAGASDRVMASKFREFFLFILNFAVCSSCKHGILENMLAVPVSALKKLSKNGVTDLKKALLEAAIPSMILGIWEMVAPRTLRLFTRHSVDMNVFTL